MGIGLIHVYLAKSGYGGADLTKVWEQPTEWMIALGFLLKSELRAWRQAYCNHWRSHRGEASRNGVHVPRYHQILADLCGSRWDVF
jgi:hypothetical protein